MRSFRLGLLGCLLVAASGMAHPAAAQQGTLTGRVTSSDDGAPVDGAQIQVLGAGESAGTISNAQGIFSIPLPSGEYSLVVEHLGYVTERFDDVVVSGTGTSEFDLVLTPTLVALSELVVTASKQEEKLVEAT